MAKKKNSFTHPRRAKTGIKWGWVVVVILLIGGSFFLLEKLKVRYLGSIKTEQPQIETKKMPPKAPAGYNHEIYTTAVKGPAPKKGAVLPAAVTGAAKGPGTVAIVIDDMGSSLSEVRSLMGIGIPLTFSVIPGLAHAKGVAEAAHAKGYEVMLHIPMEPQGYPQQRLEKNGLFMAMGADRINSQVQLYLNEVPFIVGANNHMGSRFSEHEEKMLPVLTLLQKQGFYFIDSRTSPRSVGFSVARKIGMRAGTRNIFLDNVQDQDAIKQQLIQAAGMARKKGGVIAICHPHPETIRALQEGMPELKKSGITFVSASRVVR